MVSLSDPECHTTQLKVLAITPKCSGIISFISSTFIIYHVLRDRKRRNLTYHRLLLGMSISDFFGSFGCFLSTWPIPRGEACLAAGTTQTCTAQGFFDQTSALCTPTYNVSLAIYYVLVIVKGWKETRISKIEKWLHALPICAGFGTGFTGLALKLYNPAGWICWIAPAPNNPDRHNPNYGIYRLAFLYADAWVIICFLGVCMAIIYRHVLKREKKLDRYSMRFAQMKRKQSKKIRNQAFLYVGCMYITWIFGTIFRFMQFAGKEPPTAIVILATTFYPLQGFFNMIVYRFTHILRYFEEGVPLMQSMRRATSTRIRSTVISIHKTTEVSIRSSVESMRNSIPMKGSCHESTDVGLGIINEESGTGNASSLFLSEGQGVEKNRKKRVTFAGDSEEDDRDHALELDADDEDKFEENDQVFEENGAIDELERIVEA